MSRRLTLIIFCFITLLSAKANAGLAWGECDNADTRAKLKRIHGVIIERQMFQELKAIKYVPFENEGKLPSDPSHKAAQENGKRFEALLTVSQCARYGSEELSPVPSECLKNAKAAVLSWVDKVEPTGNPINDHNLLPMLLSIDLIYGQLTDFERSKVDAWLDRLITKGDQNHAQRMSISKVRSTGRNNWNTWRLAIRGIASSILGDNRRLQETAELLDEHSKNNLQAPSDFDPQVSLVPRQPRKCEDSSKDYSGKRPEFGSYDFRQRDSMTYHGFNMEAYLYLASFVPQVIHAESRSRIKNGVDFYRSYLEGRKPLLHQEWNCTIEKIDLERREDPKGSTYAPKLWDLSDSKPGRVTLRLARDQFSDVRSWTKHEAITGDKYAPWEKFMFSRRDCEVPPIFTQPAAQRNGVDGPRPRP